MSALPPKADMCGAIADVRFGPLADIARFTGTSLVATSSGSGSASSDRPSAWYHKRAGKPVGFLRQIIENNDGMRSDRHIVGRALLVALALWALAMIIPDFYRVYKPLGSFGFYANNDGIITDVQGPFLTQKDSPAF